MVGPITSEAIHAMALIKRHQVFAAGCIVFTLILPPIAIAQTVDVIPTRRVIANVETLEYPADSRMRAPQYHAAPTPVVRYGGADVAPAYDLTMLSYAHRLSDGRVVTLSRVGARLLVFGRDGRPERVIGRMGQGPGDFMSPLGLAVGRGDSLIIVDGANSRVSWVLADRGIVREQSLSSRLFPEFTQVSGVVPSGALVVFGGGRFQQDASALGNRPTAKIGLLSPPSGGVTSFASVPDLQLVAFETRYRGQRERSGFPLRLGERGHVAVWIDQVVTNDGGSSVSVLNEKGQVIRRLRLPGARRPVTAAMRAAVIDRELRRMRGPQSERMVDKAESERIAREAPFSDSLPVVGYVRVGTDGLLWIVDPIAPSEPAWSALGIRKDGVIVARASGQSGIPLAFGSKTVLVRHEDADGVVSLALYQLVRQGRAP
jgi:hypothetical protein